MKLSPKQREILAREHVDGVCIRHRWTWLVDGEPVTRQVAALMDRGLMKAAYYRGGAATASITDAGRAAL
jgi:hypothetical protein